MQRPEKVTSHDVGDNGEQHQKNRDPEDPTVVHSPPARNAIPVMLMAMVLIVHTNKPRERY
jgi:hypothetical protein